MTERRSTAMTNPFNAAQMASGVDPLTFVGSDNSLAGYPPGVQMNVAARFCGEHGDGRGPLLHRRPARRVLVGRRHAREAQARQLPRQRHSHVRLIGRILTQPSGSAGYRRPEPSHPTFTRGRKRLSVWAPSRMPLATGRFPGCEFARFTGSSPAARGRGRRSTRGPGVAKSASDAAGMAMTTLPSLGATSAPVPPAGAGARRERLAVRGPQGEDEEALAHDLSRRRARGGTGRDPGLERVGHRDHVDPGARARARRRPPATGSTGSANATWPAASGAPNPRARSPGVRSRARRSTVSPARSGSAA